MHRPLDFVGGAYALTPPGERGLLVAAAILVLSLAVSEGLRIGRAPGRPGEAPNDRSTREAGAGGEAPRRIGVRPLACEGDSY